MDQTNQRRSCQKHLDNSLEFIQVKQVNQTINKTIFYCSVCINEDLSFKGLDYLLINQIEQKGDKSILQKWPPVNDQSILDQLISIAANAQSHSTVEHSITNFFSTLKLEISNRIDAIQKKMVNLVKDQPFDGESIIQRYQAISQICEFRNLLLSGNQADLYEKESSCKKFIIQAEEKRDTNTQQLSDLLKQTQKKQSLINFELPNQIKESILTFIDQINFFNLDGRNNNNISHDINNQSDNSKGRNFSEKIMKLISNKSNFCSDKFLSEVQSKLSQLEPLLKSLSLENQFIENRLPIDFGELTHEQLNQINHQVDHLVLLKKDEEYSRKLKNTEPIKSLNKVIQNKTNFLNNNFINKFEEYLVETQPYLGNLEIENMILDQNKLENINSLSNEMLDDLLKLSEKMIKPNGEEDKNDSQKIITKIKPIIYSYFLTSQQNEVDIILKNYPIFELLKQPEFKDIMIDNFQLEKGKWNGGDQNLMINNLFHQFEVQNQQKKESNCISNIILEKDKKYIFRFQIQKLEQSYKSFMIGLMKSQEIDSKYGYFNFLSCFMKLEANSNDVLLKGSNCGIYKDLKGEGFKMNSNNGEEIELRVCIQDQILEVQDYPNYKYKIGVTDQLRQNLLNYENLKLYIYLCEPQLKIILKSIKIVEQFLN